MDAVLKSVLAGQTENYLLPFFWLHEGHDAELPTQIQKIAESGCRAFCVESRPYEHFCEETWWKTMNIVLREAQKRQMRVWILDDKHFPTGYANGILAHSEPSLRRRFLREFHVDVMGPAKDITLLMPQFTSEEQLLTVVMYRRTGREEELTGKPIVLNAKKEDKFVYLDVPEGCWRVFYVSASFTRANSQTDYIDMLSQESVHKLIEAVYEPHYAYYAPLFGNTIAGFFSDEPRFDAQHVGYIGYDSGIYQRTVGQPGVELPWREAVAERMSKQVESPLQALPLLWYPHTEQTAQVRMAYMDAVTNLWKENFSYQLGGWCRAHGVQYIGHVIEDMNAHARLGGSAGHYFRALDGQDMSGIDVVLHQVMPGMADYCTPSSVEGGMADGEFYHYVLAQLGASHARQNQRMNGKAMCEVFGAYGWAEGTPLMKWLMDFLLVRGVNHFVPHAFDDQFPDSDCPPHFYANGQNPQFSGFTQLMHYVNRAAHLLSGADMEASGAILYHAEAAWMDADAMLMQKPAKVCYDAHISYDIVPMDYLKSAETRDGKFGRGYRYLIVPACKQLSPCFTEIAARLRRAGVPIFFINEAPAGVNACPEELVPLAQIASRILAQHLAHDYQTSARLLRIAKFTRDELTVFFLFNESLQTVQTTLQLPVCGQYIAADFLNEQYVRDEAAQGEVTVELAAGQSVLLVFGGVSQEEWLAFPAKQDKLHTQILDVQWDIDLRETGREENFRPLRRKSKLFNITGLEDEREFSGEIRYRTTINLEKAERMVLNIEHVGMTACLFANGRDLGQRICAPYCWDIADAVRNGENEIEVLAANTLVQRMQDRLSSYMAIPASGLTGNVTLSVTQ